LDIDALREIIDEAKQVAKRYRILTGKPLGISGEVGEFLVADLLGLKLMGAGHPGYDAVASDKWRIQIKARCVLPGSKMSQRVGQIRLDHEWDTVVLVLMNEDFEPLAIYEAKRPDIEAALKAPGSKARNERGTLSVAKFKAISNCVWSDDGR